jgi:hypothetical protein
MDARDLVLLAVAALVAVTTLAGLMLRRRHQLTQQFLEELERQRAQARPRPPAEPTARRS